VPEHQQKGSESAEHGWKEREPGSDQASRVRFKPARTGTSQPGPGLRSRRDHVERTPEVRATDPGSLCPRRTYGINRVQPALHFAPLAKAPASWWLFCEGPEPSWPGWTRRTAHSRAPAARSRRSF